jgi:cold shock CspA family protein
MHAEIEEIEKMEKSHTLRRMLGRCKWFSNKLGYGFLSYRDKNEIKDIFVHWSNLQIPENKFRTLYQGEYVEFYVIRCFGSSKMHLNQASHVSGPEMGPLFCMTNESLIHISNGSFFNNSNAIYNVKQVSPNSIL